MENFGFEGRGAGALRRSATDMKPNWREMTFVPGARRGLEILLKGERFAVTLRLQKGSQLSGMETEFVVYG